MIPELSPLDDHEGPALPIAPEAASTMIANALDHLPAAASPRRSRKLVWILAAAAILVAASAIASVAWNAHEKTMTQAPPPPAETLAPSIIATPLPIETMTAAPSVAIAPTVSAVVPPPKELGSEDLLRLANDQRAQKHWGDAEKTYQRVIARSPGGAEAYAATVAAASLHLEHLSDPAGALKLYKSALAQKPKGALSEDARWGIAESQRALGDKKAEADALRTFVAAHPDSMMKAEAEKRLREIGP